ncbi:hypothetical protein [Providencia phage PSTRCR_127]|nr:hypothetical protein [Providencia phage PSTRCR_127]UGO50103.1 hypothetical protein RGZ1_72 [Morganella phage vB_MmoM_Rgz1]
MIYLYCVIYVLCSFVLASLLTKIEKKNNERDTSYLTKLFVLLLFAWPFVLALYCVIIPLYYTIKFINYWVKKL